MLKKIFIFVLSFLVLAAEPVVSQDLNRMPQSIQATGIEEFLKVDGIEGLSGRFIRGKQFEHFEYLNFDQSKKLVFLIGSDSFSLLQGKTGYEMLLSIGYSREYITHLLDKGYSFKLVIFPEHQTAKPATWDNVIDMIGEVYLELASDLQLHKEALKLWAFEDFEVASGFSFHDVDKAGPTHPRYMTHERYLMCSRNLLETRAFLYFTIRLTDLFAGDGYTYDSEGNRGMKEYIALNKKLAEFEAFWLLNLDVQLPNTVY